MIIGGNNGNNFSDNFGNKINKLNENNSVNQSNPFKTDTKALYNSNVLNKNDMLDKSFAMIQERYNNGLISLDEYTKQCRELQNKRNKK